VEVYLDPFLFLVLCTRMCRNAWIARWKSGRQLWRWNLFTERSARIWNMNKYIFIPLCVARSIKVYQSVSK